MSKYNQYITKPKGDKFTEYHLKDVTSDSDIKDWSGDKLVDYNFIQDRLQRIVGKILTIVDASIPEGKQNKCVKDLMRAEFMHQYYEISDLMNDKNRLQEAIDEADDSQIESVTLKEALGS